MHVPLLTRVCGSYQLALGILLYFSPYIFAVDSHWPWSSLTPLVCLLTSKLCSGGFPISLCQDLGLQRS